MTDNILTFNVTNTITVLLMITLGFFVLTVAGKAYHALFSRAVPDAD